MDAFSKKILNRRPEIIFVRPKSVDTIPTPSSSRPAMKKQQQVEELIKGFENLNTAAQVVEEIIAERARDVVLSLDISNPEDFAVAQAVARQFPEKAKEVPGLPGVNVVTEITFPMYHHCIICLKDHGQQVGQQNQMQQVSPSLSKADFGGLGQDRRPELNKMSMIMPPVNIPAYLIATIPLLFLMLHPLRMLYTNTKIVGHTHLPPIGGPGVPVNPA